MKTQATSTCLRLVTSLALSMMFAACSGFLCNAKEPQSPASDPPITVQPFSCGNSSAVVKQVHEDWSLAEKWQIHVQNVDGPSGVTFTNFGGDSRGFLLPGTGRAMQFSYIQTNNSADHVMMRFHFVANGRPVTIEKPMMSFLGHQSGAKGTVEPQFLSIWERRGGEPRLERVTLVLTHPGKITFGRAYIAQREGKGNKFYYAETVKTDNAGCDVAKL